MRIAILGWAGPTFKGGVEKFNANLTRCLEAGSHKVETIAFTDLPSSATKGIFSSLWERTPYNGYWKAYLLAKEFEKRKHEFDLVIANDFFGLFVNDIPQITVMHGLFSDVFDSIRHSISPLYWLWGTELARVQKAALRHADVVVTPCQRNKDYAARLSLPVHYVIPHGIDLDAYQPAKRRSDGLATLNLPGHFLLSVGLKPPWKNAQIVDRAAKEYPVVVVSGNQKNPAIRYLTNVDEKLMPGLFRQADLLLHPSFHEGFGYVVAEAMACETPVIYSKTGFGPELAAEIPELVVDDPADYNQYKQKIDFVVANREKLGKRCRAFVEKHYDFDDWTKKWLRVVETTQAGKK